MQLQLRLQQQLQPAPCTAKKRKIIRKGIFIA